MPLAACTEPLHVIKTLLNKSKSHAVSNLSSHPNKQSSLSYPLSLCCTAELCCTVHCSVFNITRHFSLSHLSPINLNDIFFSFNDVDRKNTIPPSALSAIQPLLFLCFPSPRWILTVPLWIFHYSIFFFFLSLCILLNYQKLICFTFIAVQVGGFSPIDFYTRLTVNLPVCLNSNNCLLSDVNA